MLSASQADNLTVRKYFKHFQTARIVLLFNLNKFMMNS